MKRSLLITAVLVIMLSSNGFCDAHETPSSSKSFFDGVTSVGTHILNGLKSVGENIGNAGKTITGQDQQ